MWIAPKNIALNLESFDAFQIVDSSQGVLLRGLREDWIAIWRFKNKADAQEALDEIIKELLTMDEII